MKKSNILAENVEKSLLTKNILQNTEDQFMKVSNFLVNNVITKKHRKETY